MASEFERKQRELSQKAAQIDATYRDDRKAVLADRNLSQEGKQARLKVIELTRTNQVAALKADAERQLAAARSAHKLALSKARAAQVDKQRAVLGDATYLQLLDRRVRAATARDAVAMLKQSSNEWERAVLEILVEEKIQERAAAGERTTDFFMAQQEFQAARAKDEQLAELERNELDLGQMADEWIKTMDGEAYRQDFASRMRLDPNYVTVPGYEAAGA